MGYTTNFSGQFDLNKPLTVEKLKQLKDFAEADHRNEPGTPGIYCQWVPTDDGKAIRWDGGEKFYDYIYWIKYLIEKFLAPDGYVLNGEVEWQGEESGDIGRIQIGNNVVKILRAKISFVEDQP